MLSASGARHRCMHPRHDASRSTCTARPLNIRQAHDHAYSMHTICASELTHAQLRFDCSHVKATQKSSQRRTRPMPCTSNGKATTTRLSHGRGARIFLPCPLRTAHRPHAWGAAFRHRHCMAPEGRDWAGHEALLGAAACPDALVTLGRLADATEVACCWADAGHGEDRLEEVCRCACQRALDAGRHGR